MVTYDFYENTYLGTKIEATGFPRLAARAEEYVAWLQRQCQVTPAVPQGLELAVCAVAEQLAEQPASNNISAATVGNVSVRYADDKGKSSRRQLYQAVKAYLDVRKGAE